MENRSIVQETTSQTSAAVSFGREMRLPCDFLFDSKPRESKVVGGENLRNKLNSTHENVRSSIQISSDKMKKRYDSTPKVVDTNLSI